MATEPEINVMQQSVTIANDDVPGQANRIAVIGAFNSEVTALTSVNNSRTAHTIFGTMATEGDFKGTDAIDGLFYGASELLVVNITTWSDDETPVASTTITAEKLAAALAKLENEEFDMLFVADDLSDSLQTTVTNWLDAEFRKKYCHGQIVQMSRANASAYTTSVATVNDNVYYINTQQITYNGSLLSLNRSTAFIAGLIASMDVNKSLTAKTIPNVSGISPEYLTAAGELGAKLLELNVPFLKCRNRNNNVYYCVNSELPDGYDLYINRVRDYVINRIRVETYFGEINDDLSLEGIRSIVDDVKHDCVDILKLLKDIVYTVTEVSAKRVRIDLEQLVFDDVITNIDIYYSIKVE